MRKKSFNIPAMDDAALVAQIGAFVRDRRLAQNRSQASLAHAAGISRSTLSLLEREGNVSLSTLVQVLRVLNQLHFMEAFQIPETVSPLAMAKAETEKRKRAGKQQKKRKKPDW